MTDSARTKKRFKLLRAADSDAELIEKIYYFTRNDEFAALGWSDEQLKMFLKMQCDYQRQSYQMQFPEAEYSMILFEDKKIGRLIVDRTENEIRLVDIALLPEFRNRGIGSEIIEDLGVEAKTNDKPLGLQVERNNSGAFRLYRKLGFEVVGENDIYISLEKK